MKERLLLTRGSLNAVEEGNLDRTLVVRQVWGIDAATISQMPDMNDQWHHIQKTTPVLQGCIAILGTIPWLTM